MLRTATPAEGGSVEHLMSARPLAGFLLKMSRFHFQFST
jgi:hypothetical protein